MSGTMVQAMAIMADLPGKTARMPERWPGETSWNLIKASGHHCAVICYGKENLFAGHGLFCLCPSYRTGRSSEHLTTRGYEDQNDL